MEAVRVRQSAIDEDSEWPNAGRAALALETGMPQYSAALLVQSGLASRVAAMKSVSDCPASFTTIVEMREWLRSDCISRNQSAPDWPTKDTALLWASFVTGVDTFKVKKWTTLFGVADAKWHSKVPAPGTPVRLVYDDKEQTMRLLSSDLEPLGVLPYNWKTEPVGIAVAVVSSTEGAVEINYSGPGDFFSEP